MVIDTILSKIDFKCNFYPKMKYLNTPESVRSMHKPVKYLLL